MQYREAAEIARQNPGATLTRGSDGLFIVRLSDGSIIGVAPSSGENNQIAILSKEREELSEKLLKTRVDSEVRKDQLQEEITALRRTCTELRGAISTANSESHVKASEIEQLRSEIKDLEAKVSKVSEAEWARIEEADRLESEEHQLVERNRIMSLIRNQNLSYEQLRSVMDNSGNFGFSKDEVAVINKEFNRTLPRGLSPDSIVVFSKTDGQ